MQEMAWYVPLLIYLARICDVPLGTLRMMMVISGHRWIAASLGFFEVIIWVLAAGGVIRYLSNPMALVGYGAGFATGVIIGMTIEERLAIGYRIVRIINPEAGLDLSESLRDRGYRVTRVEGSGRGGPVEVAFMVVKRKALPELRNSIQELAPDTFMTVERVERPHGGGWDESRFSLRPLRAFGILRK